MTLLDDQQGQIERLDEPARRGYRFTDNIEYAFIDVYWERVSNHYLIQTRERRRNLRKSRPNWQPKPIFGPHAIEILEPDMSEEYVDQKCLDILRREIKAHGLDKILQPFSAVA